MSNNTSLNPPVLDLLKAQQEKKLVQSQATKVEKIGEAAEPTVTDDSPSYATGLSGKIEKFEKYEFDEKFEERLVAFLIRDYKFYLRNKAYARWDFFELVYHRDIFRRSSAYADKYGESIPKEVLKTEIMDFFIATKKKDADIDDYEDCIKRLFELDLTKGEQYAEDRVVTFARSQAMKVAIKDAQERVIRNKELNPILTGVAKALAIGQETIAIPTAPQIAKLDIKVEYVVDPLFPREAVIVFYAIGGIGKSHLLYKLAHSVSTGGKFYGLDTTSMPVLYVDFENPLPEIVERVQALGDVSDNFKVLTMNLDPKPPKFASGNKDEDAKWAIYKSLEPGLMIVDSLRACHTLDENSSGDMTKVMDRFKELRAIGWTILLIHHETKLGNYRGSTAIFDQCDHVLKFSRVKGVGSDIETEDEDDLDRPIRLGLTSPPKSRFARGIDLKPMFFQWVDRQLVLVQDPDLEQLAQMSKLIDNDNPPNQSEFRKLAKDNLDIGGKAFRKLLSKGKNTGFFEEKVVGKKLIYYSLK